MSFAKLSNERLRKHSLQLCSIQSSSVLARPLERMESWVKIPGLASNTRARSLTRGWRSSERFDLLFWLLERKATILRSSNEIVH